MSSKDLVSSPSFNLVNSYENMSGETIAYHMDFYRVKSKEDLLDLDLDFYFDSGKYILVEWPEVASDLLPLARLDLHFEYISENTRKISFTEISDHRSVQ